MAATNTSVTVGSASTKVAEAKGSRNSLVLTNDSDEIMYLSFEGAAVMNKGVRLNAAGGSYEVNFTNPFIGNIYAICTSGSKNLCVLQIAWM